MKPFGLINTGSICYFNSILQTLLSCKYIIKHVLETESTNEVQACFQKHIQAAVNGSSSASFSPELLNVLLRDIPNSYRYYGQQSSSEFFLFLVDKLKLDRFFIHRHNNTIRCDSCRQVQTKKDEAIHFEHFEEKAETDIESFFIKVERNIDGYKCDNCIKETSNPSIRSTCTVVTAATLIPEYLMIVYNKYFNKRCVPFPETFTKKDKNGAVLKYRVIAQIEHYGSLNGGHYLCRVLRDGEYYECNDSHITPISKLEATSATYCVLYELE